MFSCRKTKTSTTRKLHNPKTATINNSTDQSQSLIVHDSQQTNDLTRFYLATSEKLLDAKRLFSQSVSSCKQSHSSWNESLKLLSDSIKLYEQILRDINLDTVNLYEYSKQGKFKVIIILIHCFSSCFDL